MYSNCSFIFLTYISSPLPVLQPEGTIGFIPICLSVSPSTKFSGPFFRNCVHSWLYIYDLHIKFEDGWYQPIFGRVMPLELNHFKGFYSCSHFFFPLLTDIRLIFGTLLCHTKIQIKFEFGFDPFIFPEVRAHGL
jgi:hypothetical protein